MFQLTKKIINKQNTQLDCFQEKQPKSDIYVQIVILTSEVDKVEKILRKPNLTKVKKFDDRLYSRFIKTQIDCRKY